MTAYEKIILKCVLNKVWSFDVILTVHIR